MTGSFVRDDFSQNLPDIDLFQWAKDVADSAASEDIYRNKEGRKTLRFSRDGRSYFLKIHTGIGWAEIFKNLLQARLPILSARNEYQAVEALTQLGVDTMSVAAYSCSGHNPAAIKSVIITDDLVGTVSLEDYCSDWATNSPPFPVRLKLILKLADSASKMHRAGINHRDFYLCHFHLDELSLSEDKPRCYLIDLHRAQIRKKTPRRWLVKDLGGLYFSAMDYGVSRRDLLRFLRHYSQGGLRAALGVDRGFWQRVESNAHRLYRKENARPPPVIHGGDVQT